MSPHYITSDIILSDKEKQEFDKEYGFHFGCPKNIWADYWRKRGLMKLQQPN